MPAWLVPALKMLGDVSIPLMLFSLGVRMRDLILRDSGVDYDLCPDAASLRAAGIEPSSVTTDAFGLARVFYTAGNAPGVNDGASALVVMGADTAAALGLKPIARIVAQRLDLLLRQRQHREHGRRTTRSCQRWQQHAHAFRCCKPHG